MNIHHEGAKRKALNRGDAEDAEEDTMEWPQEAIWC